MKRILSAIMAIAILLTTVMILPVSAAETQIAVLHDGTSAVNANGSNISHWLASASAEFSATGGHINGMSVKYSASEFARFRVYNSSNLSDWNGAEYLQLYINAEGSTATNMQIYIKEDAGTYDGFQSYCFSEFAEAYLSTDGEDWSTMAEFVGEDMITAGSYAGTYGHLVIPANFKGYIRIPLDEYTLENSGLWGWNNSADYSTSFPVNNLDFQFHFFGQTTMYVDDIALVGANLSTTADKVSEYDYFAPLNAKQVLMLNDGSAVTTSSVNGNISHWLHAVSAEHSATGGHLDGVAVKYTGSQFARYRVYNTSNRSDWNGADYLQLYINATGSTATNMQIYIKNDAGSMDGYQGYHFSTTATAYLSTDAQDWSTKASFISENIDAAGAYGQLVIPANFKGYIRIPLNSDNIMCNHVWGDNFNGGAAYSTAYAATNLDFQFHFLGETTMYVDDIVLIGENFSASNTGAVMTETEYMKGGPKISYADMDGIELPIRTALDFENGEASGVESGINFINVAFSQSSDYVSGGNYSLKVTDGTDYTSTPFLSQIQPKVLNTGDISGAKYFEFWVKNASNTTYQLTWAKINGVEYSALSTEISRFDGEGWEILTSYTIPAGYEGKFRVKVGKGFVDIGSTLSSFEFAIQDDTNSGGTLYFDDFKFIGLMTLGEEVSMPEGLEVLSVFHDFEDEEKINSGINYIPVDFSTSTLFSDSGKSLAITAANRNGSNPSLSQVQPAWTGADVSKAQYIQFWAKNASGVDLGMTWLEFDQVSYNHSNTEISLLYDGKWHRVEAYAQLADAFCIPAGYEGYIRIKVGGENGVNINNGFINRLSMAVRDDTRTVGSTLYLDSFAVVGVNEKVVPVISDNLNATISNIGIGSAAGLDKTAIGGGKTTANVTDGKIVASSTAQGFGVTFEIGANLSGKEFIEFDLKTNNDKLFYADKNNAYITLFNTASNASTVYDFGDTLVKGLNHVRIPLSYFKNIDLSNITNVEISVVPVNNAAAPNANIEISNLRAVKYSNGGSDALLNIANEFITDIDEGATYKYIKDIVGDKLDIMANSLTDVIATGDVFTVGNTTVTAVIDGDVNADGKVSVIDMIAVRNVLLGKAALNDAQAKASNGATILSLLELKKTVITKPAPLADVYSVANAADMAIDGDVIAATWLTVWNANTEPWYDFTSSNGITTNINGSDRAINWDDMAQVEMMLNDIKAAGIDLVIFDLTNGFHDYVMPRVARASRICRTLGMKIAFATGIGTGIDTVISNATMAWNDYCKPGAEFEDIYFNYQGKPLLVDYMTNSYFVEASESTNEYLSKFTHQWAAGHQHGANKWGWQVDPSTGTVSSPDVVFVTGCVYQNHENAESWLTSIAMLDNNMMVAKKAGASIVVVGSYDDTYERNLWGKFDTTNSTVAERQLKNIYGDVSVLGYYNRVTEWLNDGPTYIAGGVLKDGIYKLSNNGKYIAVNGEQFTNGEAVTTTATEDNLNTCVYIYHLGNNEYRIIRLTAAKSLTIDGSSVVQNSDENLDTQKWTISAGNDGKFVITNKANNNALTAGAQVTTSSYSGAASQQWTFEALTTIQ
ncbi:MAG: hypothetical protein E7480_05785 [Ruminococcaceae bacterium]|nr:hypothetical protein [Oscillospiraceae bacterium]